MAVNDDLDPMTRAGLEVVAKNGGGFDLELRKELLTFYSAANKKAAAQEAADNELRAQIAAYRADAVAPIGRQGYPRVVSSMLLQSEKLDDAEILSIARSEEELGKLFGRKSDPRLANALAKKSLLDYGFLKELARQKGIR